MLFPCSHCAGFNFPFGNAALFSICTLITVVIHELSHALAASMEGVPIRSYGLVLYLIFPGAYVKLDDSLKSLPPLSQLKVVCAGVAGNICLALLCWCGLRMLHLPTLVLLAGFQQHPKGGGGGGVYSDRHINNYRHYIHPF